MSPLTYIICWPLLMAVLLAFVPRNYRFVMRLERLFRRGMMCNRIFPRALAR